MNRSSSHAKLLALAVSEWLLVLPASVLLLTALLRLLQPREYQPARSSWVIFEWARTHLSHPAAALVFIGLPGVAALAGAVCLLPVWRAKEALRQDLSGALASLRRHFAVLILGTGTLVAALILAAVVGHLITD